MVHNEPKKLIDYIEIKDPNSSVYYQLISMIKQLLKKSKWQENQHKHQLQKDEKIDFFILCKIILWLVKAIDYPPKARSELDIANPQSLSENIKLWNSINGRCLKHDKNEELSKGDMRIYFFH